MRKPGAPVDIPMADDDPDNRLMAERAWRGARLTNGLYFVEDGEEVPEHILVPDRAAAKRRARTIL